MSEEKERVVKDEAGQVTDVDGKPELFIDVDGSIRSRVVRVEQRWIMPQWGDWFTTALQLGTVVAFLFIGLSVLTLSIKYTVTEAQRVEGEQRIEFVDAVADGVIKVVRTFLKPVEDQDE